MDSVLKIIEETIAEVHRAYARVRKIKSKQVRNREEVDYLKSVAYSWFQSYQPKLIGSVANTEILEVNDAFQTIIDATTKSSATSTYLVELKRAKNALIDLRARALSSFQDKSSDIELPPNFSSLASDPEMQNILVRRWEECQRCLRVNALLAATVMMGGLLEALFVAKANQLPDKSPLFTSKSTPIDFKTKKPLQLKEWTLRPYIEVGAELGWISKPGKEIAAVLRDYRNYIHPEKERSHGIVLNLHDGTMFWDLTKSLTKQLLS